MCLKNLIAIMFVFGTVLPIVGLLRAYFNSRASFRAQRANGAKAKDLGDKNHDETMAIIEEAGRIGTIESSKWMSDEINKVNAKYTILYEEAGIPVPNGFNFEPIPYSPISAVLEQLLEDNRSNIVFVGAGLLIAGTASVMDALLL